VIAPTAATTATVGAAAATEGGVQRLDKRKKKKVIALTATAAAAAATVESKQARERRGKVFVFIHVHEGGCIRMSGREGGREGRDCMLLGL